MFEFWNYTFLFLKKADGSLQYFANKILYFKEHKTELILFGSTKKKTIFFTIIGILKK